MPELPDVTVYVECLAARVRGKRLERVRLVTPFLLRSVAPPLSAAEGKRVESVRRIGKRVVIEFEQAIFLVIHLMIAGRLRWRDAGAKLPGRIGLAVFEFENGALLFTEAGTKRRASLHVVAGEAALREFDRGGIEPLEASAAAFRDALTRENHTLKRALTDPRLVSGIGNAYSDEILHRARLSPMRQTRQLDDDEFARLHDAVRRTLIDWTERLRAEAAAGGGFPESVTAFREGMAVHGRFGKACPECGAPVQRIVYSDNETNYCARCQTEGRLLADRALSRLLKDDWPRSLDELDA
ncbi:MAG: Fpg/Nei family DNA glycosylase [bacterium]